MSQDVIHTSKNSNYDTKSEQNSQDIAHLKLLLDKTIDTSNESANLP